MNAEQVAAQFMQEDPLLEESLLLNLNGYRLAIKSNSQPLLDRLMRYFDFVLSGGEADETVICIEAPADDHGYVFTDWKREPGKTGRKDAYCDLPGCRLVKKVRTGMLFLQHDQWKIAYGPCLEHDNQVINFINAQYMNYLQQQGELICHASALVVDGMALGIAGFSGGGKSTLMLHMLEQPGYQFLTNDRLFLKQTGSGMRATGIPKLPRINPGTIINHSLLRPLLTQQRITELEAMPKQELWHLEEKYDADVEALFGFNKINYQSPINTFLILNWQFDSDEPCQIKQVDLNQRTELFNAVMKSPGPFYQFKDGRFYQDEMQPKRSDYQPGFDQLAVYEATGKVDFEHAVKFMSDVMGKAQ